MLFLNAYATYAQAKIDYLYVPVIAVCQHYILRLYVSVNNILRMDVC